MGLPPPPASKLQINKPTGGGLVSKQPGLLGEYPGAAAVNALRGLLPLPLPKPAPTALLHKPQRSITFVDIIVRDTLDIVATLSRQ